jgi:RimJ/RimL family protein N-acetyltransferase
MHSSLPLTTERLSLRRVRPDDGNALLDIYGNEQNSQYEFYGAWNEDQILGYIEAQATTRLGDPGVAFGLATTLNETGELIGMVDVTINSIDDGQGEIGFSFNHRFWGCGYATEAVHAALGFAFSTLKLHRVFAGVDTRNDRSWRLMERVGMRREAHFIHANRDGDEWLDDYTYAMLDNEWKERKAT